VREHFGSYQDAIAEARAALFAVGSAEALVPVGEQAAAAGLGYLDHEKKLWIDSRLVTELPAALRIYVGCAGRLFGDAESADFVKLHLTTGKVSFYICDDYEGLALPSVIERTQVNLRRLYINTHELTPPRPLYGKSRLMNDKCPGYQDQRVFDERQSGDGEPPVSRGTPSLESIGTQVPIAPIAGAGRIPIVSIAAPHLNE
jgi:DNA phosphorothioation-associated putative methyltransferase